MPAKIIIGADLVPTESNYNYFKGCETEYLIGKKITEKLNNADFTIFNLEVPLTDKKILLINVALIYLHLPIQLLVPYIYLLLLFGLFQYLNIFLDGILGR